MKCDLCDADYVGYTRRHLFQRIEEHKLSPIGKHLRDAHNQRNKDLQEQFTILKKCRGEYECLNYEMLFIQELKPELNTQSDSIKAIITLYVPHCSAFTCMRRDFHAHSWYLIESNRQ